MRGVPSKTADDIFECRVCGFEYHRSDDMEMRLGYYCGRATAKLTQLRCERAARPTRPIL
jgi:hypothetical protein